MLASPKAAMPPASAPERLPLQQQHWNSMPSSTQQRPWITQPTLRAAMDAKKGAPVYSLHPPTTAILPACPLYLSAARQSTATASGIDAGRSPMSGGLDARACRAPSVSGLWQAAQLDQHNNSNYSRARSGTSCATRRSSSCLLGAMAPAGSAAAVASAARPLAGTVRSCAG